MLTVCVLGPLVPGCPGSDTLQGISTPDHPALKCTKRPFSILLVLTDPTGGWKLVQRSNQQVKLVGGVGLKNRVSKVL